MANSEHIKWLLEGVESWNIRREQQDFEPDFGGANIYEEFQKSGKLDEDGYIPLARVNLRRANFQESCLSTPYATCGADLRYANLWWANLQYAQLANSKLDGANLAGTRLGNAHLPGASLRGAKMASTSFVEADLFQADLTEVKFANAYLGNANLSYATLLGADLTAATLTGADLSGSQPWEAKLYQDRHSTTGQHAASNTDKRISCVADLIKECADIGAQHPDFLLYFRGEHTNTWELRPSVMRLQDRQFSLRAWESEMLLDLMSRRPEDFKDTISALSQWALARHHGLETRLLDVTRNPLVALFNASECDKKCEKSGRLHIFSVPRNLVKPFNSDTISIVANFAKLTRAEQNLLLGRREEDTEERELNPQPVGTYKHTMRRLYHLIRQEKPFFEEQIDPRDFFRVFVVEPQQSFERVRAQSGAFLISAFHERFERSEVLKWKSGIPIYDHSTLIVRNGNKRRILDELRLLNITRETLFPGLDEAAKEITQVHPK